MKTEYPIESTKFTMENVCIGTWMMSKLNASSVCVNSWKAFTVVSKTVLVKDSTTVSEMRNALLGTVRVSWTK